MVRSPYIVERDMGSVHIKLRDNPGAGCVACVRLDAYEILTALAREEAFEQMRQMLEGKRA